MATQEGMTGLGLRLPAASQFGCGGIGFDRVVYFLIVDLMDPTRAVTATLDGPVLAVLAQAGKPLTVGEVAAQTPRGSEIGVRRSLARLVEQGIVRATEMGRNRVHELNRDHVAAPVAVALAGLRLALWQRFRGALSGWNPKPVYACVFGSAARGDGDAQSDIDVLLVRAPVAGETDPRRQSAGLAESLAGYATEFMAVLLTERQAAKWDRQVGELHDLVQGWTGESPAGRGDVRVPVGRSPAPPDCAIRGDQPRCGAGGRRDVRGRFGAGRREVAGAVILTNCRMYRG
jgi:DNA-binding transcriptional ArsR family regulator